MYENVPTRVSALFPLFNSLANPKSPNLTL
jgi:hypothetical protein